MGLSLKPGLSLALVLALGFGAAAAAKTPLREQKEIDDKMKMLSILELLDDSHVSGGIDSAPSSPSIEEIMEANDSDISHSLGPKDLIETEKRGKLKRRAHRRHVGGGDLTEIEFDRITVKLKLKADIMIIPTVVILVTVIIVGLRGKNQN